MVADDPVTAAQLPAITAQLHPVTAELTRAGAFPPVQSHVAAVQPQIAPVSTQVTKIATEVAIGVTNGVDSGMCTGVVEKRGFRCRALGVQSGGPGQRRQRTDERQQGASHEGISVAVVHRYRRKTPGRRRGGRGVNRLSCPIQPGQSSCIASTNPRAISPARG